MISFQQASATETEIAGLPAEVLANLAQEALRGGPDTSEAALGALSSLIDEPTWKTRALDAASAGFEQAYTFALQNFSLQGVAILAAVVFVAFFGTWLFRARTVRKASPGHDQTPHRIAYAEAVTLAAQMLSKGESPASVARASGLARDLVSVVGSRRLLPAPVATAPNPGGRGTYGADSYAAAEASSGQKTRGRAATQRGRILK